MLTYASCTERYKLRNKVSIDLDLREEVFLLHWWQLYFTKLECCIVPEVTIINDSVKFVCSFHYCALRVLDLQWI